METSRIAVIHEYVRMNYKHGRKNRKVAYSMRFKAAHYGTWVLIVHMSN